jgi:hypothetical protein
MTDPAMRVPPIWEQVRCLKHVDYDENCFSCREEVLTTKTSSAYQRGYSDALATPERVLDEAPAAPTLLGDDAESLLASATDMLNTWAREMSVLEARDEKDIKGVIDRLWNELSSRLHKAPASTPAEPLSPELIARLAKQCDGEYAHNIEEILAPEFDKLLAELTRLRQELREREARTDYNEPLKLAKQRVAIVERVMKLPYIKAQRDTKKGQERFVARDDLIKAIHDYATAERAPRTPEGRE